MIVRQVVPVRRSRFAVAALSVAVAAAAAASARAQDAPLTPSKGDVVPAFETMRVDGKPEKVDFPKGSRTMLLFFTSGCPHCHKMIPEWNRALREGPEEPADPRCHPRPGAARLLVHDAGLVPGAALAGPRVPPHAERQPRAPDAARRGGRQGRGRRSRRGVLRRGGGNARRELHRRRSGSGSCSLPARAAEPPAPSAGPLPRDLGAQRDERRERPRRAVESHGRGRERQRQERGRAEAERRHVGEGVHAPHARRREPEGAPARRVRVAHQPPGHRGVAVEAVLALARERMPRVDARAGSPPGAGSGRPATRTA